MASAKEAAGIAVADGAMMAVRGPAVRTYLESDNFEGFAATMRQELAPRSLVEEMLVEMAIRSAWGWLQRTGLTDRAVQWMERSLVRALENLDRLRRREGSWGVASRTASPLLPPTMPVEGPRNDAARLARCEPEIVHGEGLGYDAEIDSEYEEVRTYEASAASGENGRWRDRLTFDPAISDSSPVVKGTWVTASQVVSMIVDNWSWAEILRTHPELCEADIRACLAYTIEDEDGWD